MLSLGWETWIKWTEAELSTNTDSKTGQRCWRAPHPSPSSVPSAFLISAGALLLGLWVHAALGDPAQHQSPVRLWPVWLKVGREGGKKVKGLIQVCWDEPRMQNDSSHSCGYVFTEKALHWCWACVLCSYLQGGWPVSWIMLLRNSDCCLVASSSPKGHLDIPHLQHPLCKSPFSPILHGEWRVCLFCNGNKHLPSHRLPESSFPETCPSGRGCSQLLKIGAISSETCLACNGSFPSPNSHLFTENHFCWKPLKAAQRHTRHTDICWKIEAAPWFTVGLETAYNLLL